MIRCKKCNFVAKGRNARSKFTTHQNSTHRRYNNKVTTIGDVTKIELRNKKHKTNESKVERAVEVVLEYQIGYRNGYRDALQHGDRRQKETV